MAKSKSIILTEPAEASVELRVLSVADYHGRRVVAGDLITLPENVAVHWIDLGLAQVVPASR